MVSSITQDPYSIIISLNLASSVNLNIGAPPRPAELKMRIPSQAYIHAKIPRLTIKFDPLCCTVGLVATFIA